MKKFLALLLLATGVHAGQLTNTTAEVQAILDRASWYGVAELSAAEGITQDFTSGLFQSVTNLGQNVADTGYTTTQSNITVSATGRYDISVSASFDTATLSQMEAHVYTNGVTLLDYAGNEIGWKRTQGAGAADGSTATHGVVQLVAGSAVSFRCMFDANETTTWHYFTFTVEKR